MKTLKYLLLIVLITLLNGCSDKINNTHKNRYDIGYNDGMPKGQQEEIKSISTRGLKEDYGKDLSKGFKRGIIKKSVETNDIKISKNEIKRLVAGIIYTYDRNGFSKSISAKPISKSFANYTILNSGEYKKIQKYISENSNSLPELKKSEFYGYFVVQDTIRANNDNKMVVIMHDFSGFEYIPYVFAIFESNGDELIFEGFLDEIYGVGIGRLDIVNITKYSEGSYLLVGNTEGGDGGEVWGSTWISQWRQPFKLRMIFSKSYFYYARLKQQKINLYFSKDSSFAVFNVNERKAVSIKSFNPEYSDWHVIESDTVRLDSIFKANNYE